MRLILIRHGATASNKRGCYTGRTDEPLSKEGAAAIQRKRESGRYPAAELVAASPMQRCVQTAGLIYGRKPDIVIRRWKEMDFGEWEGKCYEELKDDARYVRWVESNGTLPIPGGEQRKRFIERCVGGLAEFLAAAGRQPYVQTAALIVHGGTVMALLSALSGEDYYSFQCKNGEGYCVWLRQENGLRIEGIEKL